MIGMLHRFQKHLRFCHVFFYVSICFLVLWFKFFGNLFIRNTH